MLASKVFIATPPAEEVPYRSSRAQLLDQGRYFGSEQRLDDARELLLALVDGCLIGPKKGRLLGEFWDVVVDVE